jgi:hypothetical protein
MKYKNPMTQVLLKEFRKFQKWSPSNCNAMYGNQEVEFNKNIRQIVNLYKGD